MKTGTGTKQSVDLLWLAIERENLKFNNNFSLWDQAFKKKL